MLTIKIEGLDKTLRHLQDVQKQVRFAAAKALTQTAVRIKAEMPAELDKALDRPTPFTKRSIYVKAARPSNLVAEVGFMDKAAAYMVYQTAGGTRQPGPRGLKLPSAIGLNQFGNIPKGAIARLIAVARKEGHLTKVRARRLKVGRGAELFYGDPTDGRGKNYPRGIYKIVGTGSATKLIPLIVFPVKTATYRPRLDLQRIGERIVRAEFDSIFSAAIRNAIATAR